MNKNNDYQGKRKEQYEKAATAFIVAVVLMFALVVWQIFKNS
jgi:uncharacterized membrane-anchored protein